MEQLKKFNTWFDRLEEPFRFNVFLVLMAPAFAALILHHPLIGIWWFVGMGIVRKFPWR